MKNKPTITRDLIRSFGRVNGRKLRPGQLDLIENLLPKYTINLENPLSCLRKVISPLLPPPQAGEGWGGGSDRNAAKNPPPNLPPQAGGGTAPPVWIEIGFGYGEHLVGLAMRYPDVNFIGCEPFINGVATLLKHIDDNEVENIHIFHGDARLLIEKLPSSSVDRLFILFPDPWPKSKHHKKRIITGENLKDFARIIKIGGRLDIATDHVDYGQWISENLAASQDFAENNTLGIDTIPEDWIETRYQLKARTQGRGARFFNLVKI